jgi:AmiR/NasT family two-component response regulator
MTDPPTLRVLIADERSDILESLAELVRRAGHEPVACEIGAADAAAAAEREHPDVAIVGIHADVNHGLDLLDALSAAGAFPVVATLGEDDGQFAADAAGRGIVVHTTPLSPEELAIALRSAHARAEQLGTLAERVREVEDRMQRRAVIERAKGVLMERHDIAEPEAYELLRGHARQERRPLAEVANAVVRARRLLPLHRDDGART